MVADQATGVLYAGQEDVGIWRISADLRGTPELLDRVREFGVPAGYDEESDECVPAGADPGVGGTRLTADVEGSALLPRGAGGGVRLLASSQGDDTFAVYERGRLPRGGVGRAGRLRGVRRRGRPRRPAGTPLPGRPLVVQDGHASPEDVGREATNFTFVDLADVGAALGGRRG